METIAFIGLEKNAGKSTALNYIYRQLALKVGAKQIALTSIGINGEEFDQLSGKAKPKIVVKQGSLFITKGCWTQGKDGQYQLLSLLPISQQTSENLIVGRALIDLDLVLEGPNSGHEMIALKEHLQTLPQHPAHLLIDGSIDRQFLGHPKISDAIYSALSLPITDQEGLPSHRSTVQLYAMGLPTTEDIVAKAIHAAVDSSQKHQTLILDHKNNLCYQSSMPSTHNHSLFPKLIEMIQAGASCTLYLNGAYTTSLAERVSLLPSKIKIVLDSFTSFCPERVTHAIKQQHTSLLHPVKLKGVIVKQRDFRHHSIPLSSDINIINIFRDQLDATTL
jgi:hypothetical protein